MTKPYSIILGDGGGHGLCNNLGVIAFGLFVAKEKGYDTVGFFWHSEDHFMELFRPIPNLIFINTKKDYEYLSTTPGYVPVQFPQYSFDIDKAPIDRRLSPEEKKETELYYYSKFVLTHQNELDVMKYVVENDICNSIAIHVRRTDRVAAKDDHEYLNWIDEHLDSPKVFILTDNSETQQIFIDALGIDRALIFDIVPPYDRNRQRHSSIVHAGKEMMIATYAKDYLGSPPSSFSLAIDTFREINAAKREKVCVDLAAASSVARGLRTQLVQPEYSSDPSASLALMFFVASVALLFIASMFRRFLVSAPRVIKQ